MAAVVNPQSRPMAFWSNKSFMGCMRAAMRYSLAWSPRSRVPYAGGSVSWAVGKRPTTLHKVYVSPVKRAVSKPVPLRVAPKSRAVVVKPYKQSRPAAVKAYGGLRGSTATKWRR